MHTQHTSPLTSTAERASDSAGGRMLPWLSEEGHPDPYPIQLRIPRPDTLLRPLLAVSHTPRSSYVLPAALPLLHAAMHMRMRARAIDISVVVRVRTRVLLQFDHDHDFD